MSDAEDLNDFENFDPNDPKWNQPKDDKLSVEERRLVLSQSRLLFLAQGLEVHQAADGSLWYDRQSLKEWHDRYGRQEQGQDERSLPEQKSCLSSSNSQNENGERLDAAAQKSVNADCFANASISRRLRDIADTLEPSATHCAIILAPGGFNRVLVATEQSKGEIPILPALVESIKQSVDCSEAVWRR